MASGFGLAWCAQPTEPLLASTCAGGSIALWDARAVAVEGARHLAPRDVYASAHPTVNDVAWHAQGNQPLLLASVGNDNALRVWDTRLKPADAAVMAAHPHAAELNCVAFSPADENLLATGDADGHIFLHDLRQVGAAAANLHASGEQLLQLAWCPQRPRLVAAVDESRVLLVNLPDHTTQEGQPDMHAHGGGHHGGAVHHAATADADVRFAHAGQASSVYDVSWSDEQEGMLASVAPVALAGGTGGTGGGGGGGAGLPEGGAEAAGSEIHPNVLHVWQPARNVMAELGH